MLLTFFAVFPLPARQTGQLPLPGAGVVAESVVSRRAFLGTTFAVVTLVANEPIGVSQLGLLSCLHVLSPGGSHTQLPLDGKKANE